MPEVHPEKQYEEGSDLTVEDRLQVAQAHGFEVRFAVPQAGSVCSYGIHTVF